MINVASRPAGPNAPTGRSKKPLLADVALAPGTGSMTEQARITRPAPTVSLAVRQAWRTTMTTMIEAAGRSVPETSSGRLLRWISRGAYALLEHLERRAAAKALHELDDRALSDIGISRSQIEAVVGGALKPGMASSRWDIASGAP
jgi:uncharacterized protein YjiS (DUF1127 family)